MGHRSKLLLLVLSVLCAGVAQSLVAAPLAVPEGLQAESGTAHLTLKWQPVAGAGLYRVAVFDAPEADGKRPLLAAVWVNGTEYVYGQTATLAKAGKYPSTKPEPLPTGRRLRAMVKASLLDGSHNSDWAGVDVEAIAPLEAPVKAATLAATLTPTAQATVLGSSPTAAKKDAEIEVQGGEEFKQTPDAAVLDVEEGPGEAAAGAGAAGAAGALAAAGHGTSTVDVGTTTTEKAVGGTPAGEAKGLLSAGRFEQAENAYRAMLEKEPENADAWEGLGDSYAGRRMKIEAKEAYEKALTLNKTKTHLKDWIDKNVRR